MFYGLNKQEIEQIIKEGKFDEDKWAHKLSSWCYTSEDIVDAFEDKADKILRHISKKELYEKIYNEVDLTDYTTDYIWDDFNTSFNNLASEYITDEDNNDDEV